ncbi:hypothetical protein ACQP10_38320 (plasmid) [Streptosporangium sandarakinum]|uniref:hypothetical protein n=1 Tax=Streptosporangium sandarakinum TaxID=1260955 RepID=UPI003D8CA313
MGAVRAFALTIAAVATAVIVTPSPAFAAGDGTITNPVQGSTVPFGQSVKVVANTDGTCDPVLRVRTPDAKLVKVAVGDAGTMCGPIGFGGTYVPDTPGTHTVVLADATGGTLSEVVITVETPPATPTPAPTLAPTPTASETTPAATATVTVTPTPTAVKTVVVTKTPTPKPTGKAKATPAPTVTRTVTLRPAAPTYPVQAPAPVQQVPQVVVNQPAENPQEPEVVFAPAQPPAAPSVVPTVEAAPVAYQTTPAQPDTVLVVLATLGGVGLVALLGTAVWATRHREPRQRREPGQRRNCLN